MALTTGRDFSWMAKHCLSGNPRRETNAPFCIKGTSVSYAVASNGRYMIASVLFPGEAAPFAFDTAVDTTTVLGFIEGEPAPKWCVSPKELIDWVKCKDCNGVDIIKRCAKCNGRMTQPCSECGGDGKVSCTCKCGDKHRTECGSCDGKRTEACDDCGGRGTVGCCCREEADGAQIADIGTLDRRYIRAALADLPIVWGKKILISSKASGVDLVRFDLDGWSLVIMPTTVSARGGVLTVEKVELLDALSHI